jgi:ADP-ribosyl cyclase 2
MFQLYSDYQPYFDVIPIATDKDQCLFWSGTFDLMTIISMMISNENIQLASSANVLSSAIINNLGDDTIWCGREGAGIDYDNVCLCSVTTKFWDQFSLLFSQSAKGTVFFLGDGEKSVGAYSRTSTFGRVELPNLDANVVTRVVALIIHRQDYGDSCLYNSGSIMLLRNDVTARSLQFDCYDIYGQANNSTHIKAIAGCVSNVISQVQDGMETEERQIECSVNGK